MAAALAGLTGPTLDAFSLSVPEAGVRTNVVGAPLESMASELRAELGSGPWLLFGKDSDGAPLRPRVLDDKQIAGGDHGLAATTSQIGRAHVCTPVTNAHIVCRLLLEKKTQL